MTDRAARRGGRRWQLSPIEGRLYAVAGLALVHLAVWRALVARPAPVAPEPVAPRPAIAIPAGWVLASRAPTAAAEPPPARAVRPARPPVSRPLRVRTRSS